MTTTQPYTLRPGRRADILPARDLYLAAFDADALLDILFPNRRRHPEALATYLHRIFVRRWWTPEYQLTVCVGNGRPVGFTWWKRPTSRMSFYERWLSPYSWFSSIVRSLLTLRDRLRPIPNLDDHAADTFFRVFADIEPVVLNSERRRNSWYLSTLCIEPKLQGAGLGTTLLRDGLRRVDQDGAAAWLIGLAGLDGFYGRSGFKEVARANVGELAHWDGGLIMFRE